MVSYHLAYRSVAGWRPTNQDAVLVETINLTDDETALLLLVADGMGGAPSGDVASRTATETLATVVINQLRGTVADEGSVVQALRDGYAGAHESVLRQGAHDPGKRGMGTTLVSALVFRDRFIVGNVGDSRAYLLEAGDITQLTKDHTAQQEVINRGVLPRRPWSAATGGGALTRVIGDPDDPLEVDVFPRAGSYQLLDGQILLLCTDGLQNGIDDDDIHDIIYAIENIDTAAEALVRAAWNGGSTDNISVVLLEYGRALRLTRSIDLPPPIPVATDAPFESRRRLAWLAAGLSVAALALGYASYMTWRAEEETRAPSDPHQAFSFRHESDTLGVETVQTHTDSVWEFPRESLHADTASAFLGPTSFVEQTGADRSP